MVENSEMSTRPKRRRLTRVILAVSLTLNLLVVGLVVGARVGEHRTGGFDPHGPQRCDVRDLGVGPLAKALSRKDRREIGQQLRVQHGSFTDNRTEMKQDVQTLLSLFQADEFDRAAVDALLGKQRRAFAERGLSARNLVLDRVENMSVEQRREFARNLKKSIRFKPRKGE